MKIVSITNLKGGVAKTTVSYNLAGVLAERGKRVLLIDMDYQGSLTNLFENEEPRFDQARTIVQVLFDGLALEQAIYPTDTLNVSIVPSDIDLSVLDARFSNDLNAHFLLAELLEPYRDRFDYILIDCPPNLFLGCRMAFVASDSYIVPVLADRWSLRGVGHVSHVAETIRRRANPKLELAGIVLSRIQNRKVTQLYIDEFRRQFGRKVLETQLKERTAVQEAATSGKPITSYDPHGEAAEMFRALATELGL